MELRTVSADEPLEGDSEELVYAAAVLILSEDLYPRKLEIIREYIQNASDALDDFIKVAEYLQDRSEPQIKISIQGRSLLIFDNGIGMDEEEIAKLKRIAYSEKRMGEEAGYKGIGRLAGIAVANKLKISSTSYGDPKLYHFEFRARDMRQDISESKKRGVQESATKVINRHTEMWFTDIDPDEHYTLVELRDIHESHDELLEPEQLMEYIGDIAPVDFPPEEHFSFGPLITENLFVNVPDYSPKSIFLSGPGFDRQHIYKPYTNEMLLAKPEFKVIRNPDNPSDLLAYYWYAPKGQQILGKVRPVGRIFSIEGRSVKEKYRLAGLVYKLFGFTIGDRTLPERTLWTTTPQRARWYTGEIHIIDKSILPTTDRSNFVENESRAQFFSAAESIPVDLNREAEQIANNRKAHTESQKFKERFQLHQQRLNAGQIESGQLKNIREDISEGLETLKKRAGKCKDSEILKYHKQVTQIGRDIQNALKNPKLLKSAGTVSDIATELKMPTKARKVFQIIMDTLREHHKEDREEYHGIASKIYAALRKKY